jgi:uncharacterized membrane protein
MYINGFPIDPWNWFWWLIGLLICVAIISAIVRTIVHAVRGDRYHHHHHHWDDWMDMSDSSREARRILDARYAKGEINEEEYKRMKENLK